MKTSAILNHENTFPPTGLDSAEENLTEGTSKISGNEETIQIMDCARDNGDKSFYYREENTKYRRYNHFATSTTAQYYAFSNLIKFLCAKYSIPKNFISEPARYEIMTDVGFKSFTGIVTHVNCRTDKVDIGPAFDWNKVIQAVNP